MALPNALEAEIDAICKDPGRGVGFGLKAYAGTDVRWAMTPPLRTELDETSLIVIDLGAGKNRLGDSILAQATRQIGNVAPDLDDPAKLKAFVASIQQLNRENLLLAYHDRSDGGLFATLCEMPFAGRCGVT